ncbi:MAG: LmeA family phospholipid-binding protein [Deltaproteobacteria bacterium]|nr:LmeA family phospholipid-binding protein [Nannocystaceae bacterium]
MKKLLVVLIVLGVLLAIAIGVGAWLDGKARAMAEEEARKRIVEVLPRMRAAKVEIEGFPFLFDVLVSGSVDRLRVELSDIENVGVSVESVVLVVDDIAIDRDLLLDQRKLAVTDIGRAELTARLTGAAISKVVREQVELDGSTARIKAYGLSAEAQLSVVGRRVELKVSSSAPLPPEARAFLDRPLVFQLPPEEVLPCTPALHVVDSRLELGCTVTELPPAVKRALGQR